MAGGGLLEVDNASSPFQSCRSHGHSMASWKASGERTKFLLGALDSLRTTGGAADGPLIISDAANKGISKQVGRVTL